MRRRFHLEVVGKQRFKIQRSWEQVSSCGTFHSCQE